MILSKLLLDEELCLKIKKSFIFIIANAKIFEFFINENVNKEFQIKGTLLEAIPDYISLGYDKKNTKMKIKGAPIGLNLNLQILTNPILFILLTRNSIKYL